MLFGMMAIFCWFNYEMLLLVKRRIRFASMFIWTYNVEIWGTNVQYSYFSIFQSRKRLYIHKCLSVRPSVCPQNPSNSQNLIIAPHHHADNNVHHYHPHVHPHHSSFILHHPSSSFFIHPSFISWLESFSACFFNLMKFQKILHS